MNQLPHDNAIFWGKKEKERKRPIKEIPFVFLYLNKIQALAWNLF
jgi:hypothetical protein